MAMPHQEVLGVIQEIGVDRVLTNAVAPHGFVGFQIRRLALVQQIQRRFEVPIIRVLGELFG